MQDANLRIDIDHLGRARAFDKSVSLEAGTDLTLIILSRNLFFIGQFLLLLVIP